MRSLRSILSFRNNVIWFSFLQVFPHHVRDIYFVQEAQRGMNEVPWVSMICPVYPTSFGSGLFLHRWLSAWKPHLLAVAYVFLTYVCHRFCLIGLVSFLIVQRDLLSHCHLSVALSFSCAPYGFAVKSCHLLELMDPTKDWLSFTELWLAKSSWTIHGYFVNWVHVQV
jgi:hypothetical protein